VWDFHHLGTLVGKLPNAIEIPELNENSFCDFYKSVGHDIHCYHVLDLMWEDISDTYHIQEGDVRKGDAQQYERLDYLTPMWGHGTLGWGQGLAMRGRGGFGWGRGPIVCFNYGHLGNLMWYCIDPCTTCTYRKLLDHVINDFPLLVEKWWEKRGPNVKMFVVEPQEDHPHMCIVTKGGTKIGMDMMKPL